MKKLFAVLALCFATLANAETITLFPTENNRGIRCPKSFSSIPNSVNADILIVLSQTNPSVSVHLDGQLFYSPTGGQYGTSFVDATITNLTLTNLETGAQVTLNAFVDYTGGIGRGRLGVCRHWVLSGSITR
jgi:hypothetical protein